MFDTRKITLKVDAVIIAKEVMDEMSKEFGSDAENLFKDIVVPVSAFSFNTFLQLSDPTQFPAAMTTAGWDNLLMRVIDNSDRMVAEFAKKNGYDASKTAILKDYTQETFMRCLNSAQDLMVGQLFMEHVDR